MYENTKSLNIKRKGSLLFDVILYIIAAAVVLGGIYLSFSFLKGEADVNSMTANDSKAIMDAATSFRSGYYDSQGKYHNLSARRAAAWSSLDVNGTAPDSHYTSTKFDHQCEYTIAPHDNIQGGTPTVDARYGVYIDCSAVKSNQNWDNKKTYQVELAFANAFKSRIPDAIVDGKVSGDVTTYLNSGTQKWNSAVLTGTGTDIESGANGDIPDGKLFIYDLHE